MSLIFFNGISNSYIIAFYHFLLSIGAKNKYFIGGLLLLAIGLTAITVSLTLKDKNGKYNLLNCIFRNSSISMVPYKNSVC